tara:strand:- start:426 stop:1337 length:912 start_codon:yes stop_codon:yes gene_type:complete
MSNANPFTYAGSTQDLTGTPFEGQVPFNLIGWGFNGLPKSPAGILDVDGYDVVNAYSAKDLANVYWNLKSMTLNTDIQIEFTSNITNTPNIALNPSATVPSSPRQPEDRRTGIGATGNITAYRADFFLNDLHPYDTDDDGDGTTDRHAFEEENIWYESSARFNANAVGVIRRNGIILGYGFGELAHALAIVTVDGTPGGQSYYQYQYTGIFGNLEDESGIKPFTDQLDSNTLVGDNSADSTGPTVTRSNITIGGVNFRQIRITHRFDSYADNPFVSFTDGITGMASTPFANASIGGINFWTYA